MNKHGHLPSLVRISQERIVCLPLALECLWKPPNDFVRESSKQLPSCPSIVNFEPGAVLYITGLIRTALEDANTVILRHSFLATADPPKYVYVCACCALVGEAFGSDAKRRVCLTLSSPQVTLPPVSLRVKPTQNVLTRISFRLMDTSAPIEATPVG